MAVVILRFVLFFFSSSAFFRRDCVDGGLFQIGMGLRRVPIRIVLILAKDSSWTFVISLLEMAVGIDGEANWCSTKVSNLEIDVYIAHAFSFQRETHPVLIARYVSWDFLHLFCGHTAFGIARERKITAWILTWNCEWSVLRVEHTRKSKLP